MVDPVEAAEMDLILLYCGFTAPGERASIAADGFEVYEDIKILTAKDIGSLAKGFAERTAAAGRIQFGVRRTNLLKAIIHWVKENIVIVKKYFKILFFVNVAGIGTINNVK